MHGNRIGLKTVCRKTSCLCQESNHYSSVKTYPSHLNATILRLKSYKINTYLVCYSWLLLPYVVKSCYVSDEISTGLVLKWSLPGSLVEHAGLFSCKVVYWRYAVDCVWNVVAHAHKPDFVFRRNGRVHLNRGGVSSVDYWHPRCAHQR